MKAVTKLLFVALLIGVTLSLPNKADAGTASPSCNWPLYGQCVGSLNQWMNQCTSDCTMNTDASGNQSWCYSQISGYTQSWQVACGSDGICTLQPVFTPNYSTTCYSAPAAGGSCVQTCGDQYNEQYRGCLSSYCTTS